MARRGFTLIELLVALTLFGVIATLLASGIRLSLDVSARGNKKADSIRAVQMQRGLLRDQLQGALPFRYWTNDEANRRIEGTAFLGESSGLRFVSRDGQLDGPNSLPRWVEYRVLKDPDGRSKIALKEHRILTPNNEPSEDITAQAEMPACSDARFEYLDTDGEKLRWFQEWNAVDRKSWLPFAVRIACKAETDSLNLLIRLEYADSARRGMKLQ
jgi:prepilin-type N-terminal cleavage/methylation domain-containing protein